MKTQRLQLIIRLLAVAWLCAAERSTAAGDLVVIGNPNVPPLDARTIERIYTGRVIEVNGIAVTAINASTGSQVRIKFLQNYLNEDEEKYEAYWIVRRYIGKGTPPREITGASAVVDFVRSTPGAIGYVEEGDVTAGVKVLAK